MEVLRQLHEVPQRGGGAHAGAHHHAPPLREARAVGAQDVGDPGPEPLAQGTLPEGRQPTLTDPVRQLGIVEARAVHHDVEVLEKLHRM